MVEQGNTLQFNYWCLGNTQFLRKVVVVLEHLAQSVHDCQSPSAGAVLLADSLKEVVLGACDNVGVWAEGCGVGAWD